MSYVYSERRRKRKDKRRDKKKHPYKRGGKERVRGLGIKGDVKARGRGQDE